MLRYCRSGIRRPETFLWELIDMEMFCDREVLRKEKSPGNEWSLYIYGPSSDTRDSDQPFFYASFRKIAKDKYIAVPFGRLADPSEISVKWDLPGDVCAIYIGGDCYVLFNYGIWRFHSREFFRRHPEPPFGAKEMEAVSATGQLP